MKKFKGSGENRLALKGGSYSLAITAVVLAILIVINILASSLPATVTKLDMSESKLYSVTSATRVVVNNLEKDVTIYWIVQADKEDSILENLLAKYDSLSDHIEVVKRNPDIYPTFASQYTDETVQNNSLIVECGDRNRYIDYSDIYVTDIDMYYYSYTTSFDGEGAITSAIDYVVSDDMPQLYILEGHGESELPSNFAEQIEKDNIETTDFSLLNIDAIPEEADCILINAPSSDISEEERDMLVEYVENGGKLQVFAGPTSDGTLTNLYSILSEYGVEATDGIVVESDRDYYTFQLPLLLLPNIESSEITDSLISERAYPVVPVAQGLKITGGNATALLTTSDTSFSKAAGYAMTTYDKEDGDEDGPFAVAVSIDCGEGGIVWFSSSYLVDDLYNAYSSGANIDIAMNALASLIGESEALAIRSKSLSYSYLTISDSASSLIKLVMIGIAPLCFMGVGVVVILRRRRLQNETNE